jgi:hypothetical protein
MGTEAACLPSIACLAMTPISAATRLDATAPVAAATRLDALAPVAAVIPVDAVVQPIDLSAAPLESQK